MEKINCGKLNQNTVYDLEHECSFQNCFQSGNSVWLSCLYYGLSHNSFWHNVLTECIDMFVEIEKALFFIIFESVRAVFCGVKLHWKALYRFCACHRDRKSGKFDLQRSALFVT